MNVIISDLETLYRMFLCVCYDPQEKEWVRFEVSEWRNDIDRLVRYVENHPEHYFVYYNGLRFDTQVLEYIICNYEKWWDKTSLEICEIICQVANDTIHDSNYDVFPRYREGDLSFKTIDPYEINHFSNRNRMVSLKRLEFELDMENIEEMSIHHMKPELSREEAISIISYCKNDVWALYLVYLATIGETTHPLYRENNQIELRQDIEQEFGIKCLNYSDSKIGDEMIKKFYCEEKHINYQELPKKGTFRKAIEVKNCIAKYVKFVTPQMQEFLRRMKLTSLTMKDDFKEELKFHGNVYSFMKGGLHTENKPEIFEATEDKLIIDYDVSSYYPAIIINNGKYPFHLGKEFLRGYKHMFEKRLELKPLSKNDKRIKGIVNALKLAVNSVYGKSSDMTSWLFDRQLTMFTTITGELSLMMLIEQYELNEIRVISANTDGVTIFVDRDKIPKVEEINAWWMSLTQYELERTDYKKIIFSTVNDYLAIKTDGEIKKKGDYVTDFELYKNKSARIVPIALEAYYVHGIPIEETISSHRNIYDFCIRQKASRDFHYEGHFEGKVNVYNKLIRYYVSLKGEKILKIKNPECMTNAASISQVEAGQWLMTVCNYLLKTTKVEDCNIDFDYYIERANRIVYKIEHAGKKMKPICKQQLTLW